MNISLNEEQYKQISWKVSIREVFEWNKAIEFDKLNNDDIVGFTVLRKYDEVCYFL